MNWRVLATVTLDTKVSPIVFSIFQDSLIDCFFQQQNILSMKMKFPTSASYLFAIILQLCLISIGNTIAIFSN